MEEEKVGMKWFKWMIWFALFASALWNAVLGILFLTGYFYTSQGVSAELVYSVFPSVKVIDIIYGVVMFILAALLIFTRFRLAKFKDNAPKLLYLCYIICIVAELIYNIAVSFILGESAFDASGIVYMIAQAVMLIVNVFYFRKRNYMFIN